MTKIKLLLPILTFYIVCSCSAPKADSETTRSDSVNKAVKSDRQKQAVETESKESHQKEFLALFKSIEDKKFKVQVDSAIVSRDYQDSDFISLHFLPYFQDVLSSTRSKSTGSMPFGKVRITDASYGLILYQLDDYGPIYYFLTFDLRQDRIVDKEVIAQEWGDAGDSQVTYSDITMSEGDATIRKRIITCNAVLEEQGNEIVTKDEKCIDSTAVVKLSQKSKNWKAK